MSDSGDAHVVSARLLRSARRSITTVYFIAGALYASWAPRIPEVKAHLHLSNVSLGFALFAPAIGAVVAMPAVGALVTRHSSKTVLAGAILAFSAPPVLIGLCGSLPPLFVVLLAWGVGIGALEVSMNTQAVTVQAAHARPVMAGLHAWYSIGALVGAGLGALAASMALPVEVHLAVAGGCALGAGLASTPRLIRAPSETDHDRRFPKLERRLVALGAMSFACLLCEGAAADWSAVYLRDSLFASAGIAGLAYAVFSAAMAAGRLGGDRLTVALGERHLVMLSGAIAAVGFGVGLAIGTVASTIVGFGALGLGLACVLPLVFSAAGRVGVPAPSIAAVTTSGYLGFLAGPPTIGAISGLAGLQPTLGIVVALAAAITAISRGDVLKSAGTRARRSS